MTVQDYYRAFERERRAILRTTHSDLREPGDYDAADEEAFEAVVTPLLEARRLEGKQS